VEASDPEHQAAEGALRHPSRQLNPPRLEAALNQVVTLVKYAKPKE